MPIFITVSIVLAFLVFSSVYILVKGLPVPAEGLSHSWPRSWGREQLMLAGLLAFLILGVGLQCPWLALAGLCLGPWLPRWARAWRESQRRKLLAEQMPGTMEALSAALRSGQSLVQALESARADVPEPSAALLDKACQDLRLGDAPELALEKLAAGLKGHSLAADWGMVATAVAIQRQSGGDLAVILDQVAETLRERQRLQAQVDALTAQGRLSAWVVGSLPPLLLLALQALDPDLVAPLFTTPTGWLLLGAALMLELVGILVLRRLVDISA